MAFKGHLDCQKNVFQRFLLLVSRVLNLSFFCSVTRFYELILEPTMVAIRSITTNEHVTISKVGTHTKKCQLESKQEELGALR